MALFGPATQATVDALVEQGKMHTRAGRSFLSDSSKSIAFQVNLRQVGQRLTIVASGRTIEDTDIHHAVTECFPGSIYYSQGASYDTMSCFVYR
jgi:DEAD/DEAH box helicase domain-containing protein